jgi:hypothetical protein
LRRRQVKDDKDKDDEDKEQFMIQYFLQSCWLLYFVEAYKRRGSLRICFWDPVMQFRYEMTCVPGVMCVLDGWLVVSVMRALENGTGKFA